MESKYVVRFQQLQLDTVMIDRNDEKVRKYYFCGSQA